jgi:TetR/AcrR family transcriptional regulator, transcriptional repressor for nem operon
VDRPGEDVVFDAPNDRSDGASAPLRVHERIVRIAADLMRRQGVARTSLDEVRAAAGVEHQEFEEAVYNKTALVRAVVALHGDGVLERQARRLEQVRSYWHLYIWRDEIVSRNEARDGVYGCELGSLASEVAEVADDIRAVIADYFCRWQALIAQTLHRLQLAGEIHAGADSEQLAIGLMAALQGGYLLAQTARDVRPIVIALDLALNHIGQFAIADGAPPMPR